MMIEKNKTYTHYTNRQAYIVKDFCKIQENDIWVKAVIYTPFDSKTLFVRSLKEFKEKFKLKN